MQITSTATRLSPGQSGPWTPQEVFGAWNRRKAVPILPSPARKVPGPVPGVAFNRRAAAKEPGVRYVMFVSLSLGVGA